MYYSSGEYAYSCEDGQWYRHLRIGDRIPAFAMRQSGWTIHPISSGDEYRIITAEMDELLSYLVPCNDPRSYPPGEIS